MLFVSLCVTNCVDVSFEGNWEGDGDSQGCKIYCMAWGVSKDSFITTKTHNLAIPKEGLYRSAWHYVCLYVPIVCV